MNRPNHFTRQFRCSDCPAANAGLIHRLGGLVTLAGCFILLSFLTTAPAAHGGEDSTPWWQAETTLGKDATLILTNKSWWPRAQSLKVGEHFLVKSERPGGGQMLVRREHSKLKWGYGRRKGGEADILVWVLDDDGDFRPGDTDGDRDSDCYVADYQADGRVDRMVDYIDNDRDGKPDEMDIRYFHDGRLRIAWFGIDLDKDGHMWSLGNYEYAGGFFRSDPYGNNLIYANKLDPEQMRWVPISECPFSFYDTDGDGESEAVVRVSAVPLEFDPAKEPDPGNSLFSHTRPFEPRMRNMGAVNIRYGIDLDNLSGPERRLHYDLGFNLIGRLPYKFPGMGHTNPLRRPPKTTNVIPHNLVRQVAETYPAEQTGFSWHEYGDDAVTLGFGPHAGEDRRWEGVFWTWRRRFMHNTGGPTQKWNMRREFRPAASVKRELYYSRVDRRIHLKGATDGWIRVGHLANREPWGEIRMFDTDGDGYFDRWETYRTGTPGPVRVATVLDAGIRDLPNDWDALHRFYTRELLPEALEANDKLTAAMRSLDPDFAVPENLAQALKAAACDGEKRYVQDLIRECRYLALRDHLARRTGDRAIARLLSSLDAAYGEGRYGDAAELLGRLAKPSSLKAGPGVEVSTMKIAQPAVNAEAQEFCPTPPKKREFYYCRADHRIHLKGATEGRIRFNRPGDKKPWAEIRYFDTDQNGHFDRWEVYLAGALSPARVGTARDPGIRDISDDQEAARQLFPDARRDNQKLMAAMRTLDEFAVPEPLAQALKTAGSETERLLIEDLIRELQYLALRDKLTKRNAERFTTISGVRIRGNANLTTASIRAWNVARIMSNLDAAYGEGRYDDAVRLLNELAELESKPGS